MIGEYWDSLNDLGGENATSHAAIRQSAAEALYA